jgi:hypothetical protein
VIGVLHGVSAAQWTDRMVGFHRGLREAGFIEGRNVAIEYRWAEGQFDRLPAMAIDLIGHKVAVILAGASDVAIKAAMAATKTTPIVFTSASDPVRAGFVSSLGHPGGNVTGATFMGVICPGWTETAIIEPQISARATEIGVNRDAAISSLLAEKQPSRRTSRPEEIGSLVLWLAHPTAHNITGVAIPIDGGWTAQ